MIRNAFMTQDTESLVLVYFQEEGKKKIVGLFPKACVEEWLRSQRERVIERVPEYGKRVSVGEYDCGLGDSLPPVHQGMELFPPHWGRYLP
jgi:hypothetical protein